MIPNMSPDSRCPSIPVAGSPMDVARAMAASRAAEVRKPLLTAIDDNLNSAKGRCAILSDLIDSLESSLIGSGRVSASGGNGDKAPSPVLCVESLVGKSDEHAAVLTALTIRLENLINRL